MVGAILVLLVWRVLVVLVALVLGFGLVVGATAWGFGSAGLLLPGVPVALAWGLSAASCNFVMHSVGSRERTKLRRSFESYLDPRIISQFLSLSTPNVSDALDRLQISGAPQGILPLYPCGKIVGPAATLKLVPTVVVGGLGSVGKVTSK